MTTTNPTPANREELVEFRAEQFVRAYGKAMYGTDEKPTASSMEVARTIARMTLVAEEAAGLAVVPVAHDTARYPLIGEFEISVEMCGEADDGEDGTYWQPVKIGWSTIKAICDARIAASPYRQEV